MAKMTPEEREEYELQSRLRKAKDASVEKNAEGMAGSGPRKQARKSDDIAEGKIPKPADTTPVPQPASPQSPKEKAKEEKEIAEGDTDLIQKKKLAKKLKK